MVDPFSYNHYKRKLSIVVNFLPLSLHLPFLPIFRCYSDLPPLGSVMIKIYRENYKKSRREKTPATDVGKIEMPALILESGQLMEKWYAQTRRH